jgi:hypothetical protein
MATRLGARGSSYLTPPALAWGERLPFIPPNADVTVDRAGERLS